MDIAFRVGSAAVANFLSGLGCIFLLSQLLVLLKGKPDRLRVAAIGCVQGLASLVSMALSFEIVDGVIDHLAFPLIAISGIVRGPAAAVITGVFAAIFRLGVGGHIAFALVGVGAATLLGVGLAKPGRNVEIEDQLARVCARLFFQSPASPCSVKLRARPPSWPSRPEHDQARYRGCAAAPEKAEPASRRK